MIIIFSTQSDYSTNKVAEWIYYFGKSVEIINEINPIIDINFNIANSKNNLQFTLENGKTIDEDTIDIIWYRRGLHFFKFQFTPLQHQKKLSPVYHNLLNEYEKLTEAFFVHLANKTIGEPNISSPNKLVVLSEAIKCGLTIPKSKVISSEKNKFSTTHIVKNISDVMSFNYETSFFYNRTKLMDDYPSDTFFPSLFQEFVQKQFELRIFYFIDTFFSMAIIPPFNQQLNVDYREITGQTFLNRIKFKLPRNIEKKLSKLIHKLGVSQR